MADVGHGIALRDLPLTADGKDQIDTLDAAFKEADALVCVQSCRPIPSGSTS